MWSLICEDKATLPCSTGYNIPNEQSFVTAYSNSVHKSLRTDRKYVIPMCTNMLYGFLAKYAHLSPFVAVKTQNSCLLF